MVSWRNPTAEFRDWGLAGYIDAIEDAIEATCEITGHRSVAAVGACAGGITLTADARLHGGARPRRSSRRR